MQRLSIKIVGQWIIGPHLNDRSKLRLCLFRRFVDQVENTLSQTPIVAGSPLSVAQSCNRCVCSLPFIAKGRADAKHTERIGVWYLVSQHVGRDTAGQVPSAVG